MKNLKPGFKIFMAIILIVGVYFGVKHFMPESENNSSKSGLNSLFSKDKKISIGVNTYAGFAPIVWLNGGKEPNKESILYKEYGLLLDIKVLDDFETCRASFKNNEVDIIYCTADALPTEMGVNSGMEGAKHFMLLNWSRGADAIVVNKSIQTVADLKGKTVAVTEGTAAHTLLINVLETNGIDANDIKLVKVANGGKAAELFKANQVDACVTWSPDDADCVASVKGSKVLISTKTASNIVCDGLLAKEDFINNNREDLQKFVSAILYANTTMNNNPEEVKIAAKYFKPTFDGIDEEFCIDGCKNIRFATLGDNIDFYGLNPNYTGTTGENLYSKMSRVYSQLKLTTNPISWRKASDASIIEALSTKANEIKGDQSPEKNKLFTAPTKELETVKEISNKSVTIEYAVNSDILDNAARVKVDQEVVEMLKQFAHARMRIEGNCDNTGNATYNKDLSRRRAQNVANYLAKEYNFDINRFVVVGNGSSKAISAGSVGNSQQYRTTDFQLISE